MAMTLFLCLKIIMTQIFNTATHAACGVDIFRMLAVLIMRQYVYSNLFKSSIISHALLWKVEGSKRNEVSNYSYI